MTLSVILAGWRRWTPVVVGSDRAAADAVRARIDWDYDLGLELDDPGFGSWMLSESRARLAGATARISCCS